MCGQATAEAVAPVGGTYTSKSGNKGPLINSARSAVNGSALHMVITRGGTLRPIDFVNEFGYTGARLSSFSGCWTALAV